MDYPHSHRHVDDALLTRRSVRAFLPRPVSREQVEDLLRVASRAPSGTNIQPWKVHVLTGERKAELSRRILEVLRDPAKNAAAVEEYHYYPAEWVSPYVDRRRKIGWDMYGLLGISKGDKARMAEQAARNYVFFDAPVGFIFTIDRLMRQGSWLDYGMFLQSVMIAARGRGLDTCPQQAFTRFHKVIGEVLELPPEEMVVCGMALGYADASAPVNQLRTEREPLSAFVRFHDA